MRYRSRAFGEVSNADFMVVAIIHTRTGAVRTVARASMQIPRINKDSKPALPYPTPFRLRILILQVTLSLDLASLGLGAGASEPLGAQEEVSAFSLALCRPFRHPINLQLEWFSLGVTQTRLCSAVARVAYSLRGPLSFLNRTPLLAPLPVPWHRIRQLLAAHLVVSLLLPSSSLPGQPRLETLTLWKTGLGVRSP